MITACRKTDHNGNGKKIDRRSPVEWICLQYIYIYTRLCVCIVETVDMYLCVYTYIYIYQWVYICMYVISY